ncbi:GNAT family N-acetyltransferase [Saccharothrix sp. ALI-22-I]|uniref:GNAT family N-acetyltransferase n=1 Tax=Saccharothrix sp. ALI-22-I TaxID=1933778 RepID=UPI001930EBE5|nr:GNAT family N-acetyltransferase [Saccharothrix sp. ALI-22-I]
MGETMVRRAVPDDAEGIARVHTTTWQVAYRGVVPDEFLAGLSWERRAEGWRRALAEPSGDGSTVFVAVEGDVVVGFTSVGPARDEDLRQRDFLELHAIYVHPSVWGSGVGFGLLEASFADVGVSGVPGVSGVSGVMLWVLEDNPRARRFYERAGFAPDGVTRTETVGGRELVELRYVKQWVGSGSI